MRTLIKICGITSVEDAIAARESGADAIGLVFYAQSTRAVDPSQAAEICQRVGPFITTVGLFVNEDPSVIRELMRQVPLQLLQFHGDETPEFCEQFGRPYLKAVRVQSSEDVQQAFADHPKAVGILLDAYVKGVAGGTGQRFNWSLIPEKLRSKCILAGGLTPENVSEAVQSVRPLGVDVSGGVESSPGVKDPEAMTRFCRASELLK